MKKICFVCAANLKHMTLISLYTNIFKSVGQAFDIIYLDKYGEIESYDGVNRLFCYELKIEPNWSFPRKLFHYWGFRRFAVDTIKRENYDFVIVWNEFTAFMMEDFLRKHYAGRYCVNIRDQNFNRILPVQYRYKKVLEKSCFNTLSSDRFREIFPKADYLFVHSYNTDLIKGIEPAVSKRAEGQPIRILFIGRMSYPDVMKKIIDALGNDPRFEFSLIGAGCETFADYILTKGYSNIMSHGSFNPTETTRFLNYADVIYSLNKENDIHSDTLLPIKLYYAIAKHIPILAFKSSYTYEYAAKHHMDIGVSESDFTHLGDVIADRYAELPQTEIDKGCESALQEITESHEALEKLIRKYILS